MSDRVSIEPAKHIRVRLDGKLVAETARGYTVREQGLPDRYYVPRDDIRAELSVGAGAGTCPWKGEWRHLDVTLEGTKVANGAWTYFVTKSVTDPMRDFVAFYESKFAIESA